MDAPSEYVHAAPLDYESTSHAPRFAVVLGTIGVRLLGIYLIFVALAELPALAFFILESRSGGVSNWTPSYWMAYAGPSAAHFIAGFGLAIWAPALARRWFGNLQGDPVAMPIAPLLTLVIVGVGLWALVASIGAVVSTIVGLNNINFGRQSGPLASTALMSVNALLSIVTTLAQPVAGALLILYAPKLARLGMVRLFAEQPT